MSGTGKQIVRKHSQRQENSCWSQTTTISKTTNNNNNCLICQEMDKHLSNSTRRVNTDKNDKRWYVCEWGVGVGNSGKNTRVDKLLTIYWPVCYVLTLIPWYQGEILGYRKSWVLGDTGRELREGELLTATTSRHTSRSSSSCCRSDLVLAYLMYQMWRKQWREWGVNSWWADPLEAGLTAWLMLASNLSS